MTEKPTLIAEAQVRIRFNEVDAVGIVWHGSYVSYFEDAREAFGRAYGLDYLTIFGQGFYAPLVDLQFSFKSPLQYGDTAIVEITYLPSDAAKICFSYRILSADRQRVVATGSSVQVFMDKNYRLELYTPEFYLQWQKQQGLK